MNKGNEEAVSRRKFLTKTSAAMVAAGIVAGSGGTAAYGQDNNQPPRVDTQKPIKLPPFQAEPSGRTNRRCRSRRPSESDTR